jgi:hypothetical protein
MLDQVGGVVAVRELVVDPRWRLFAITIDGKSLPVLRIEHPRHGDIDCTMTVETMRVMHETLGRMLGLPA